ncbi:MAG: Gfo/Idh/MocA family protein [Planctomycetaceae bacterium]
MTTPIPRRRFLQSTTLGTAGALTAGYTGTAAGFAANETLNVGCIGTGGRCRRLMQSLAKVPGVKITAVCDVWDRHLELGKKLADAKAFATKDHHALLKRKDVDAVLIASPDHWHVPLTVDACAAGKDVYVEKPLTHDLSEGKAVVDAQNKHKRIVQVGMQQRSMPHLIKARELIQSGKIGKVIKVHCTWNRNVSRARRGKLKIDPRTVDWTRFLGNARKQPFDAYRFRHWRWFWDFGGGIFTDLMVHWIDVVHWVLDLKPPAIAASIGDHFMAKGLWQTPDTVQTLLKYPDKNVEVYFEGTFSNARNGAMTEFMGTDATLYCDRGRYEIHPERHRRIKPSELVLGTGPRGRDFYDKPDGESVHLVNWIEAVRSRKPPSAPAEAGVGSAAAAHLANKALREGKVVRAGKGLSREG